jgi:hypothetical protein
VASKEVPAPEERGHGNPEQHHGQDLGLQTRAGPEAHKNPKSILSCVGLGRWLRPKRSSHAPLTLSQVSAVRGCLEEPVSPLRPAFDPARAPAGDDLLRRRLGLAIAGGIPPALTRPSYQESQNTQASASSQRHWLPTTTTWPAPSARGGSSSSSPPAGTTRSCAPSSSGARSAPRPAGPEPHHSVGLPKYGLGRPCSSGAGGRLVLPLEATHPRANPAASDAQRVDHQPFTACSRASTRSGSPSR